MSKICRDDLQTQYHSIFKELDVDCTGMIAIEEMVELFQKMGRAFTSYDLQNLLHQATGSQKSTAVGFDEFVFLLTHVDKAFIQEEEMLLVFQYFDKDGDGFISPGEIRDLLHSMGDEITEDDLSEMIAEADKDGDGKVSYKEFVSVMSCTNNSQKRRERSASSGNEEVAEILPEEGTKYFDADDGIVFEATSLEMANSSCHTSRRSSSDRTKRRQSCFVFSTSQSSDMLGNTGFYSKDIQRPWSRSSCGSLTSFDKEQAKGSTTPKKRLSLSASASFLKGLFRKKTKR